MGKKLLLKGKIEIDLRHSLQLEIQRQATLAGVTLRRFLSDKVNALLEADLEGPIKGRKRPN